MSPRCGGAALPRHAPPLFSKNIFSFCCGYADYLYICLSLLKTPNGKSYSRNGHYQGTKQDGNQDRPRHHDHHHGLVGKGWA